LRTNDRVEAWEEAYIMMMLKLKRCCPNDPNGAKFCLPCLATTVGTEYKENVF